VWGASVHVVGVHPLLLGEGEAIRAAVTGTARTLSGEGLRVYGHVRRGDPGLVLPDVAEEEGARLIVVGAGERRDAVRRVLGSTADAVARRAPCDVLIVRPPMGGPAWTP
jgi:nucleotide-binding universal stress UspA family protein